MLKFGASCIVNSAKTQLTDEDIDAIIDRTPGANVRREASANAKLLTECQMDAAEFDAKSEALDMRKLGMCAYIIHSDCLRSDLQKVTKTLAPNQPFVILPLNGRPCNLENAL